MRPLRLIVEGFTCFKERQDPLDFSQLDLFAISGPTGAGKSSLLDAILFALYGKVPRMKKGYAELIALGRERMSVVLDFRRGDREFRVTRTGRRGRSAEAQLDEIGTAKEKSMAGGVHAVDAAVAELLGLGYEAFTQAVVLPQGEFARFLKSQPRERREILRDLLRLQIYERMRRRAAECSRDVEHRWRSVNDRLEEDYREAKPERLEELARQRRAIERRSAATAKEHASLQQSVDRMRQAHQTRQELMQKQDALATLERQEGAFEVAQRRLAAAKKIGPVVPLLEAFESADRRAKSDGVRAETARDALAGARDALEKAKRRLEAVRPEVEALPTVQAKIRALDEARGLAEARALARRRFDEGRVQVAELERNVEARVKEVERVRRKLKSREKRVETLSSEIERSGYDPELDEKLDQVRESASELVSLRAAVADAESGLAELTARTEQLRAASSEKELAAEAARNALREATARREEAETNQRKMDRQHTAAHLRADLESGKKCPVCDQPVRTVPAALSVPLLDAAASRVEACRKAEADVRARLDREGSASVETRTRLEAVEKELRRVEREHRKLVTKRSTAESVLAKEVGPRVADEEGRFIEEKILAAIRRLGEARSRDRQARARFQAAERDVLEVRGHTDRMEREIESYRRKLGDVRSMVADVSDELGQIDEKIGSITEAPDPIAERERLAKRVEHVRKRWKEAEDAERRAAARFSTAQKGLEENEHAARQSIQAAREAKDKADAALRDAGCGDASTAREAVLTEVEIQGLEETVSRHREERHALRQRITELRTALGGEDVTERELSHAEEELARLGREQEEGLEKKVEIEQEMKGLEQRIQKAKRLVAQREALGNELSIYRRLAEDLRSERFQSYLLEEAFRELVLGASYRLEQLSGRYTLEYRQDTFHVLDQDNARERRSADTLSGGETFLASLALALELSEQVQRAAGAVHLDSLFIDEGFGTLDAETLDTVASAIESLHVGGRMVGIITHLSELTARLPAAIRVNKSPEGSRARLEFR